MSRVISFPSRQDVVLPNDDDTVVEKANERMKKRLGVSIWEYLGLEGEKDDINSKMNRSMQKESIIPKAMVPNYRRDLFLFYQA